MNDKDKGIERKFIKDRLGLARNRTADVVVNRIRGLTNADLAKLLEDVAKESIKTEA